MNRQLSLGLLILIAYVQSCFANWPENRGPNHNYHVTSNDSIPKKWSVIENQNILWRTKLPETGHSGIAIWGDRLFLTCFREFNESDYSKAGGKHGTWVSETKGYCLDSNTGEILWSCDLPGKRPNQVNGTFTDSTTPMPVTDGKHVWFVNAGGYMACHSFDGKKIWGKEFEVRTKHSAKQFQPFLHEDKLYYVMMRDMDDKERRPQTAKDWDKNSKTGWPWMFVRAFDAMTGESAGIIKEGITVHSKGAMGWLNGERVLLHAKGGGHSPPEKPFGLGLSKLNSQHDLVWEREGLYFEGSHYIDDNYAYCFDKNDFFVLDLKTGETLKQIRVRDRGKFRMYDEKLEKYVDSPESPKISKHIVTHRTNMGYGKYHFFMSGVLGVLGRIDLETEEVSYFQVPVQVKKENEKLVYSWKKFDANDGSSSGFVVEGDKRRLGHGFGHISAATPVVLNDCIYFTTVLGTVYVVDAKAEVFDENALLSVNDLGHAGETWTLSPFSYSDGRLYQRTSRELICIGSK